jgi:4-amino-4-deoxy-L-arabinose transferase-like glycosyltransferase
VVITVASFVPFLNKPFHIDDPLFLWMAQQISKHPLDPYGFSVNWGVSSGSMWKCMQNPPLCPYYIAAVASLIGWRELALHLAFLIWPIAVVLGTFALARRFCREPLMAALLTLFTPVLLVSATNVMCDVMLAAFWVWSIECWIAGLQRRSCPLLALSATLAAAAALTKYFGVAVVPLLVVYTIVREGRFVRYLSLLAIPLVAVIGFELATKSRYETGLFSHAASVASAIGRKGPGVPAQILTGLAFTGGCLVTALFFLPRRVRNFWLLVNFSILVLLALFYFFVPLPSFYALGPNTPAVWIEGGIFATIGAGILALGLADLVRHRDADSLFLLLWIAGTFTFASFCNWSISGRAILPMAPAVAILVMRWRDAVNSERDHVILSVARILIAATMSLVIVAADYRQAKTGQEASREFQTRFQGENVTVWFESHWGFQYYMQQWGARPLDATNSEIFSGDVLVFPMYNTSVFPLPMENLFPFEEVKFPTLPFVSTHGRGTGAAFYSSSRGPLPWSIDHVAPETYFVARFR